MVGASDLDRRGGGVPAPTLTAAGLAKGRDVWRYRNGSQANACERDMTAAPTVHFGHRSNQVEWVMEKKEDRNAAARGAGNRSRPVSAPAATIDTRIDLATWTDDRPSTTVNGDPRISRPGHHDETESGSQQRDAVRVTVEEAATLQGFPADFPWRGSRTAQFRQVGNAVPPPLARAILAALLGATEAVVDTPSPPARSDASSGGESGALAEEAMSVDALTLSEAARTASVDNIWRR